MTLTTTSPFSKVMSTVAWAVPACLVTLVSASCTMRYTERSMEGDTRGIGPCTW